MASIDDFQAREIYRCATDIGYFARNYCYIRHPAFTFPLRFTPWDWQLSHLYLWASRRNTIDLKTRQWSFSTMATIYANWVVNFAPGIEVYLLSQKEEKAISLLRKAAYVYDRLPDWMRAEPIRGGRSKTRLGVAVRYWDDATRSYRHGESIINSLTTTSTSGAGESANLVICDEVALWKERMQDEIIWAAVAPTTTHGGQLVMGSTPRGYGGVFHRVWVESIAPLMNAGLVHDLMDHRLWNRRALEFYANRGGFIPQKIHYSMSYHNEEWIKECCRDMKPYAQRRIREYFGHIVYDTDWRDRQAEEKQLDSTMILQEYELYFDRPGDAAFDSEALTRAYKPPAQYPEVADLIKKSKRFFIGVDCAEGPTKQTRKPDYNSITALTERGVQAAAEHNRHSIKQWAGTTEVNPITGKIVEFKGDVLTFIEKYVPSDIWIEKQSGQTTFNRVSPHAPSQARIQIEATTAQNKPMIVRDFSYGLENGFIIITDYFTLECCRQYINKGGGKYEAAPGFYDDPVMSIMMAFFLLSQHGYYTLNLTGESISDETRRIIGVDVVDDLSAEEAGFHMGAAIGPEMSDEVPEGSIAGMPSMLNDRPFRGQGRHGFRRHFDDERQDMFTPRVRRPRSR